MISPTIIGALMLGFPALVIAYVALWRRNRPVFWFALALIVVGLGYLASTGALAEIADYVQGAMPAAAPAATPAP